MKACQECKMIMKEGGKCPACGSDRLTEKFNGMITIFDHARSKIGQMLGAKLPGSYAVRLK